MESEFRMPSKAESPPGRICPGRMSRDAQLHCQARGDHCPQLPTSCWGAVAAFRGAGGIRDIGAASGAIGEAVLHQCHDELVDLAFCWKCDEIHAVEDGSHCTRCRRSLAPTLAWPLWSRRLRLRFIMEAFAMLRRWLSQGRSLPE